MSGAALAPPEITAPASGGITGAQATISGTAEPGSTVSVTRTAPTPGTLGTATANPQGAWSVASTLADGNQTVYATAAGGGVTSAPSALVTFTVDTIKPSIGITSPEDDYVFSPGDPPVLTGTASDDRELLNVVLEFWMLGQRVDKVQAECACEGTSSDWSYEPALEPGSYDVFVWSVDMGANWSLRDQVSYHNAGGNLGFSAPDLGAEDLLGEGELPIPALASPDDGSLEPGADEPIEFSGTTAPGTTVLLDEEITGLGRLGTAYSNQSTGSWHFETWLPSGTYGVRVQAMDEKGNVSSPSELIVFEVDANAPLLAELPTGTQFFPPTEATVLSGGIEDNRATEAVLLEYWQGNTLVLRDLANCDCGGVSSTWSHSPDLWQPGYYHVIVHAIDEAGNWSPAETIKFVQAQL